MAGKKNAKSSNGGMKGFLSKAGKSFYAGGVWARDMAFWTAQKSGRVGFILATTSMVVLLPLLFEIGRETQSLEVERSQVKDLRSQGYTDRHLQEMGFCEASIRPPSVAMLK
mmetsp:Transcript_12219/g.17610  ORF Transcript_12219/g.17610 Transcript_12219/m.17610 type:complete len:112 (+) Transcript_12219:87-422(+)